MWSCRESCPNDPQLVPCFDIISQLSAPSGQSREDGLLALLLVLLLLYAVYLLLSCSLHVLRVLFLLLLLLCSLSPVLHNRPSPSFVHALALFILACLLRVLLVLSLLFLLLPVYPSSFYLHYGLFPPPPLLHFVFSAPISPISHLLSATYSVSPSLPPPALSLLSLLCHSFLICFLCF